MLIFNEPIDGAITFAMPFSFSIWAILILADISIESTYKYELKLLSLRICWNKFHALIEEIFKSFYYFETLINS